MMTIPEILKKMIAYSKGNLHDIDHLLLVHSYAKTIGELEGLDAETQKTLEVAAILHDIACPLCREKYGNTNGKYQEIEGEALAREFLSDCGLSEKMNERIVFLVSHHHTVTGVDGIDYQILLEADYIVNAEECTTENRENTLKTLFKTKSGTELFKSIYGGTKCTN